MGARCGARRCRGAAIDGLVSAAPYGRPLLRELLRLYKYERIDEAGLVLVRSFGGFARRHRHAFAAIGERPAVVPVPMHFFREAYRGFNQANAFAAVLGAEIGAPCESRVLRRRFRLSAQAGLEDDGDRRRNAAGSVTSGRVRRGGTYLVVDDVATSGATLDACAHALKSAGAAAVWGVTLLRGGR